MLSAAALLTLARPGCFTRPSAHQHAVHRFFRFVDPKVEAQYRQHSAGMWRATLRIYCIVSFLLATQELLSYLDDPAHPLFRILLSISVASSLLLLVTCWRSATCWCLPLQAIYACLLGAVYTYEMRVTAMGRSEGCMDYIFNAGQSIAADPGVVSRTSESIQHYIGLLAVRDDLLYSCVHWVTLGLAGFNGWTVLAYGAVFAASVAGVCESPIIADKFVGCFYFVVATFAFSMISVVLERTRRSDFLARTQLAQELQASQLADSVLNHMLKNTLADVAANVEIFLAGELGPEVLEDAVASLRRGIRSCRERLVYLKMVAGEYTPVLNAVNLREFGQQLVAGRSVASHCVGATALLDGTLLQLILENALSNAFKHGLPDNPNVQLVIKEGLPPDDPPAGRKTISFIVKNTANPLRPILTDELVQTLFQGEARPTSPRAVNPALSDGIGIQHCVLAARLGGVRLSLRQEEDLVVFTAQLDVDVLDADPGASTEEDLLALVGQFPAGLRILCLDDSPAARRLMEFHLKRWCPSALVRTYGAAEDDISAFLTDALREADIVIMDQNLEYTESHHGTDLCRQLLGCRFAGLICIRSSDDSQEDQARYTASGAHCSFGKDMLGFKMVHRLKAAYVQHVLHLRPGSPRRPDSPLLESSISTRLLSLSSPSFSFS
eukprot:EG_transcript_2061